MMFPYYLNQYLEQDEEIKYFEKAPRMNGGKVLTNQRVFFVGEEGSQDVIALADITSVDIGAEAGYARGWRTYILGLGIRGQKELTLFKASTEIIEEFERKSGPWFDDRKWVERFPRKICEVTGLPFAIPKLSEYGEWNDPVLEFYVKTDLVWPMKCAACLTDVQEPEYDTITISRPSDWNGPDGLPSVSFEIPYCSTCYEERFGFFKTFGGLIKRRTVKESRVVYDGIRAHLRFKNNRAYADEFIKANSGQPIQEMTQ